MKAKDFKAKAFFTYSYSFIFILLYNTTQFAVCGVFLF